MKIAALLASFNRKEKTLVCLKHIYEQVFDGSVDVYLLDDASTDGTLEAVKSNFPNVTVLRGTGSLYWAGSMRTCWKHVINISESYDSYLLINDDTILLENAIQTLIQDSISLNTDKFIIVGSTMKFDRQGISYGGRKLRSQKNPEGFLVIPNDSTVQECDLGNANIMMVSRSCVEEIGVLAEQYVHGLADYDYTLRAKEMGIGVYISSKYLGLCDNDHGRNWKSSDVSLSKRIKYLYDVKGLSYHQYLYYIKRHFPNHYIVAKSKLWIKTMFPVLWDRLKK